MLISLCTGEVRYIIITVIHCNSYFAFHKVVRRHYSGDVSKFTTVSREIFF